MRIGYFTDSYLPSKHGVETSVESFRVCLEKLGHEVFIYAPFKPGYHDENKNVFRLKSIRVIKKPEMRFALPIVHNGKLKELLNLKLDIVHAQTPFSLGVLGKIIAAKQKIPMLYTHHTDYPEYMKVYLKEKVVSPYIAKKLTASFANSADAVIAPSKKVMDSLKSYGTKKPIYVIPNGVDLKTFKETPESNALAEKIRTRLGIKASDKILLYLGRICVEKNIQFILRSFKKISESKENTTLIIAGDGPDLERLKTMTAKLRISSKVFFPGFIPNNEKPAYYRLSDIFIFASQTDTQGIVILEAMASGNPVVALKDGAFAGMVINNQNGYVVEKGENEFAKKILKILNSQDLHRQMSQASLQIVEAFSETKVTEKLLSLYKEILQNHER